MKITSYIYALLLCCIAISTNAQNATPSAGKSMAVVLKFTGDNGIVTGAEVFSSNIFDGKSKTKMKQPGEGTDVRVKCVDEAGATLYEGSYSNPLLLKLENYHSCGSMSRSQQMNKEGYLNLRFAVSETTKTIKIESYVATDKTENLISTLTVPVQ